ncbi:exocyst complex component EXO84 [Rhodotorula diobovata]|uniref:Cytochrome b-c1 complex subunit 2, mitochondrial n=1 Tax=Rhodotorula diobovata TaxID=5288 RepID=A0A5C5FQE5_9BASI|nr:exocyst complex component EXO84 [Rhodotorula diobovata]
MSLPALRTQAIRAQASRNAFVRSYATPAFEKAANGIAIAAADEGKPTSSISIIARAGSRFEPAPGVAHVLKNSVFKATNKRSQIRLVRETEALGGVLSTSLSREHLVLTAEFLRGDEAYFAEALGDAISEAKLPVHEYHEEVVPAVQAEYEQLIHDSGVYAFDLAHQLAFRKGLGNSLFASPHTAVDHSTAVSFAKSSFAPSNIAVYGSNIDAGKLSSLVGEFFTASGAAGSLESQASKYYGGEVRVPATAHAELDQLLVAFKGAARSEVEYAVLALLLGGEASVKWGQGATPLAKLHTATSSAKAFNAAYSDAGLFGISVQAKSADVADVASKAVAALKQAAQGVSDEALKQAVAKAKFAAAAALETKAGQVAFVGEQVASGGKAPSLEDVFAKLDKVSAESLAKAAKSALESKPTTVAVGNTHVLPCASSRTGAGAPQSGAAAAAPAGRARAQSNVGARLLKKRQSVAYHAHPGVSYEGAPAMPPMPPMPQGAGQGPRAQPGAGAGAVGAQFVPGGPGLAPVASSSTIQHRAPSPQQQQKPQPQGPPRSARPEAESQLLATGLDVDQLASEGFKPEDFLKQSLPSGRGDSPAQMEDLRRLKGRLESAMKITEGELQKSVFNNYADFVLISKEIATLENEMLELKGVLEEWRAVPESLEGGWGDDDLLMGAGGLNRRTQRNSIADLATLYKSQLSALWEGVEGSQKFLPYVPGRHIITEASSFLELHAATYKPKQPVHLFLLNDAMLVSVKKRRGPGIGGPVRLVAERCFNLSDIVVVDLKDAGDLQNAVKIKRGKETILYRTDKAEDKKMLLLAFKKVAEELMNKRRKEMLSEAEARKGDPRGFRSDFDGTFASSGFSPAAILGVGRDDPSGKDLSWIGDYSDELAVSIATREFEDAVVWVEKGKSILPQIAGDAHASQLFRAKLDQRTHELVSALLHDLSDHAIRKSGVVRTTTWLLRLGQGERARETFLSARGRLVRKRARQIKFEGDISMYISELAMVCFTLIKNTCEWYMAAFKDNRMASGFVRWASEQVEIYAEMFRRQVYGADQDGKVIEESLEVTKAHGAVLRDVGLDFTFLLDGLLRPQKPAPQPRVSSSRLRDDALTGSHLRPPKAAAGAGADPSGARAGEPTSAVALARQSIFSMQGGTPSGEEEREVPRVPEGRGSGEEARGAPAGAGAGAGASQQGVGEAQ